MDHFDEDIKIAGTPREPGEDESAEQLYLEQKENGNIDKAHLLGQELADYIIASSEELSHASDGLDGADYLLQKRLLLAFAVLSSLDILCPNLILSKTASSEILEMLKEESPEIYQMIQEETAFTAYYLSLRREQTVNGEEIGKTFATLCGADGNDVVSALGTYLYLDFLQETVQRVEDAHFI